MSSLLNKVNFTKGWPSKSIVEAVLMPDSGVEIEAGFVGRRKHSNPDVWILGITAVQQEAFIFRNDFDDPDAARASTNPTGYVQVPIGGVQGISLQNPLEIETTQYAGTPAPGDMLYAASDGLLKIAQLADGSMAPASPGVAAGVVRGPYTIGNGSYICVVPVAQRFVSAAS